MSSMLRSALLATTVAVAVVLAAPVAAAASTLYPPSGSCTVSPSTPTAGGSFAFSCADATFGADEPVRITVTGESGEDVDFGFVRFAISTGSTTSRSGPAGELDAVTITLPADARGVYNVAAVSESSAGGTASATVATEDGTLIPGTGGDGTQLALWITGGLLLLAGGAFALVAARRSRRD